MDLEDDVDQGEYVSSLIEPSIDEDHFWYVGRVSELENLLQHTIDQIREGACMHWLPKDWKALADRVEGGV